MGSQPGIPRRVDLQQGPPSRPQPAAMIAMARSAGVTVIAAATAEAAAAADLLRVSVGKALGPAWTGFDGGQRCRVRTSRRTQ